MENEEKEVFTAEDIKEQAYEEIIKDVIEEIDSREENLKVYYPYFVINKKLQDEKTEIDLNSVFVAILSYLLYTGKLNNRKIEYQDIIDFTEYFIYKIYNKKQENVKEIVNKILDVAQNNGNNFTYEYYSLKEKENKDRHIKYIEIKLGENGKLNYYITPQGIDFYLKTKEFPDSAQITINLLLFRKQIEKGSFNYAYDTIKRLNIEVKKKSEQKELVLEALMYGGKEGIEEYNKYHESVEGQINEEEELFGEVLELVDNIYNEYLAKNESNQLNEKEKQTISLIKKIEKELNKTINSHTKLLKEAIEMTKKHDEIIGMRARSAFSEKFKFEQEFEKYKSIMEHRRYISKTQFDNEYQIYKQLSKAFFSVAVKLSSFAYKRIGNRIISIEEDDIISMEEVSRIISVNSTAQNLLFENAPFIPEEIYNEYLALNELANTLFWGIIARIKEYEAECVEINKIITEDEIGMSEDFQNRLNDVNKKVRKYLETLTIIAD